MARPRGFRRIENNHRRSLSSSRVCAPSDPKGYCRRATLFFDQIALYILSASNERTDISHSRHSWIREIQSVRDRQGRTGISDFFFFPFSFSFTRPFRPTRSLVETCSFSRASGEFTTENKLRGLSDNSLGIIKIITYRQFEEEYILTSNFYYY